MNHSLREKLRSESVCYGSWLASGAPVVAELASLCGLDWMLLDMEHGFLTEEGLLQNLQATSGGNTAVVVRVPTHEAGLMGRVLDRGADAIMVPHVESAEQARALVRAMRYPPEGERGYSRSVRACGYGVKKDIEEQLPLLFVQIESVAGVQNVEEIAAVDGVDVLFVGPADLKLSLAVEAAAVSINYEKSLDRVIRAAKSSGIHAGILVRDRKDLTSLIQLGFTKTAVDSDLSMLRDGFLSITKRD